MSVLFLMFFLQSMVYSNNLINNWEKLSKPGPIKCQNENNLNWNRSIEDWVNTHSNSKNFLISYKCDQDEYPIKFTFKGKINNFQLEGPGKLRIINNADRKEKM